VLRRLPPHLILSDLVLAELDGLTALDIARKELPEVPFIFFSGTLGEEHAIEALRRGAVDYVLKSNPTRLVPAVANALREVSDRARQRTAEQQARETEQRLHDQQRDRIARLTRMLQMQSGINAAVLRIRDREDLLREACRLALQVGGYEHAMVSLVAPDGRHAEPWYTLGMLPEFTEKVEFPIGDGTEPDTSLVGRALRTGEITISTDLTQSEPPVAGRLQLLELGFHSVVALPLTEWAESDGTFTNRLGMVQRIRAAVPAAGDSLPAWEVLSHLARKLGATMEFTEAKAVFAEAKQKLAFMKDADWGRPMLPVQLRFAGSRG